MYTHTREKLSGDIHHYRIFQNDVQLGYMKVLDLWHHNASFRSYFIFLMAASAFSAYRFETPPIAGKDRPFEFVLIDYPFLERPADATAFDAYFHSRDGESKIVVFENLGKDAVLVTPCPLADHRVYAHLAPFVRQGPKSQNHKLWQVVAQTAKSRMNQGPVWLNTHGGGVPWLHFRLDSQPKYYGFDPYMAFQ